MNIEDFYNYCLKKPFVEETFPFDKTTLVFKVKNKMFALCDIDQFDFINLKCDPERAIALREEYQGIQPGYHMSKIHWNSVYPNQDVPDQMIFQLIDHSYALIVQSLPKKERFEP
ncbi:MAG: MmcQ/YjbR family DNA-binding protein [Crocinitomicaceae bacterium]